MEKNNSQVDYLTNQVLQYAFKNNKKFQKCLIWVYGNLVKLYKNKPSDFLKNTIIFLNVEKKFSATLKIDLHNKEALSYFDKLWIKKTIREGLKENSWELDKMHNNEFDQLQQQINAYYETFLHAYQYLFEVLYK